MYNPPWFASLKLSRARNAAPTARSRATASEAAVALCRARWRWLDGLVGLQLLLYYSIVSIYYYTTTTTKQGGANGRLESIVESLLRRPPSSFSPSPRCLEGRMPLPAACTMPTDVAATPPRRAASSSSIWPQPEAVACKKKVAEAEKNSFFIALLPFSRRCLAACASSKPIGEPRMETKVITFVSVSH